MRIFLVFFFVVFVTYLPSSSADDTAQLKAEIKKHKTEIDSIKKVKELPKPEKNKLIDSIKKLIIEKQDNIIIIKSSGTIYKDEQGNEWYNGATVYTGPRGGKYIMNSRGKKEYIKR